MIKLRSKPPAYVEIELAPRRTEKVETGEGDNKTIEDRVVMERATARVRPATAADADRAGTFCRELFKHAAALGDNGFDLIAIALGEDAGSLELTEDKKDDAYTRMSTAKLTELCMDGWTGVCDENGDPAPPTLVNILLLQTDVYMRARFNLVLNAAIHEQVAEKNASAASPTGGAAAAEATAQAAGKPESPAL